MVGSLSGFYEPLIFVISFTSLYLDLPGTPKIWTSQYGPVLSGDLDFPTHELKFNGRTGALLPAAALVAQRLDALLSPWRGEATGASK